MSTKPQSKNQPSSVASNCSRSPMFDVRWLIRRDLPEVCAIESRSTDRPWSDDDYVSLLRKRNCIALVVMYGPSIVGQIIYELYRGHLQILRMVVDVESRRRGAGRAIMERMREKLSQQRRHSLCFDVSDQHTGLHLFLRAEGFRCSTTIGRNYRFVYEINEQRQSELFGFDWHEIADGFATVTE